MCGRHRFDRLFNNRYGCGGGNPCLHDHGWRNDDGRLCRTYGRRLNDGFAVLDNEIGHDGEQSDRDKCDGEAGGNSGSEETVLEKADQPWAQRRPG
jgi:hypothetical protein